MRPLTDTTPKPLLPVRGKPLMQWAMEGLQRGGVRHLAINTAWLGEQIPQHFGFALAVSGQAPMQLHYSQEGLDFGGALETAGGIARALPWLLTHFGWLRATCLHPILSFRPRPWRVLKPAHSSRICGWCPTPRTT